MRQERGLRLFALEGSRDYARGVARQLNVELAALEERDFEDGEHKARPRESLRGQEAFVLHSLYGGEGQSPNDKLCRLLFFCSAVKDAGAASVTAVVPYLCYARKDRRTKSRDPVTTRYVAALFEASGVDRVVTLEVHNLAAFENAFRCNTVHLDLRQPFVNHLRPLLGGSPVTVISPDAGGLKRAEGFRQTLAAALDCEVGGAFMEKYRSSGVVSGEMLVGDLQGRIAIVLDDLIASGGTMLRTARKAREQGAIQVVAVATHGLFAGKANEVFADPLIDRLVIGDTVPPFRLTDSSATAKLEVVDSRWLVAEAIRRLQEGGSLVDLLGIED